MSSICVDSELKQDHWYRISAEMLGQAGIAINGTKPQDIRVNNTKFFQRVLQEGSLGLGESYMDGWWDCDRLDIFFQCILTSELDTQRPKRFSDVARIASARIFNYQTRKRAWIVGKEHYDLGNDLFSRMLDSYMQYSCAYWKEAKTLEQAQQAKLRMICEKLQLKSGMKLLDIGCGWGGLSAFAAKEYGVSVKGVTISVEQQVMAQERCKGLDVQIQLQDYRDLNERFDLNVDPWINKYIFPNGCLPSVTHIASTSEDLFVLEDWHNFGCDYDRTLMAWFDAFQQNWPQIKENYNDRFYRMFTYYLNACAGAFRARNIQLWQVLLSPKGVDGGIRVYR